MFLSIATTRPQATDLGFALHKHPDRVQTFEVSSGVAKVFYPVATDGRCECILTLDVDPVAAVRGGPLEAYVDDRLYVAGSFLAVAIGRVFRSAMKGDLPQGREDLAGPWSLEVCVGPIRATRSFVEHVLEPFGWEASVEPIPIDAADPDRWETPLVLLRLRADDTIAKILNVLYVLLPAFDVRRHFFQGASEVEKLMAAAGKWLVDHPMRNAIVDRYLGRRRSLTETAHARLDEMAVVADDAAPPGEDELPPMVEPPVADEFFVRLHDLRHERIADILAERKAGRVVDLGCGSGELMLRLLRQNGIVEVTGVDVGVRDLERARKRIDKLPPELRDRGRLLHGSLVYGDARLTGYDAGVLSEVVEHIEPERLDQLEQAVFGRAHPMLVVVTTPNREYNVEYGMGDDQLRHPDHRFEWTRAEFKAWAEAVAGRHGYRVAFEDVGFAVPGLGAPSQMGVFAL